MTRLKANRVLAETGLVKPRASNRVTEVMIPAAPLFMAHVRQPR